MPIISLNKLFNLFQAGLAIRVSRNLYFKPMKKIKLLLPFLFLFITAAAFPQRKVVFIILDGIPADVVEDVPTPVIDAISAEGGYTRAYLGGLKGGYSESPTVSAVGYNHVLTGTWSNKHNVWDNEIEKPNYHYWNVFRIAKSCKPDLKTAIFSSWTDNRTKLVGEGLASAGNLKFDYSYDGLELDTVAFPQAEDRIFMSQIDEAVSSEAGRYIREKGPDLSWVYLEFTDDMGHMYGDSPQFTDAVKKADAQVGKIWDAIRQRTRQYGEDWMIVITTDHGRDMESGKDHGGQTYRERTTWIATNAKSLNRHFKEIPAAVDIAPSILAFMNLTAPEPIRQEFDGTSFIGPVAISNLGATRSGKKVTLTWTPFKTDGQAEVKISATNNFSIGKNDSYTSVGKVDLAKGSYSFDLPNDKTRLYKILLCTPENILNVWVR